MGLRHSVIFTKIEELRSSELTVSARMQEIIKICSTDVPHPSWAILSALDYDSDVASLHSWIPNALKKQNPAFPIKGLWIGLSNPCLDENNVWSDMLVRATEEYEPNDEELSWLWKGNRRFSDNAEANSASLRSIYKISYVTGGLGNDAEWPLCLAFAVFATCSLLKSRSAKSLSPAASCIGVAVGFNDGDMLIVGELTDNGFVVKSDK